MHSAEEAGHTFGQTLAMLVEMAMERRRVS
jgi:hypothetical protein